MGAIRAPDKRRWPTKRWLFTITQIASASLLVQSVVVASPIRPIRSRLTPQQPELFSATDDGIARVWAIDDGEKILRDDLNHPLSSDPKNPVWDGETIQIFGARNEVVAFQLILQANASGAKEIDVQISDLLNGQTAIPGSNTGSADPFDYVGRSIELFTEHYLHVENRSSGGNAWAPAAKPISNYLGWVPDALIPFSALPDRGGAPFSIGANQNQGVWVDIWIPEDVPPGTYQGTVEILAKGHTHALIPIKLDVFNFTLSDETHLHNMFGFDNASLSHRHGVEAESAKYYGIEARYHQMAHRHRFDLVRPVHSLTKMDEFHKFYLTGKLYTKAYDYDGPGYGIGNTTFSIGLYGAVPQEYGGSISDTYEELWWAGSDAWAEWFQSSAPQVDITKYLFPDEPETNNQFRWIKRQARWSHSNPGIGHTIPTYVTHWIDSEYQVSVDFWSTPANFAHPQSVAGTNPDDIIAEREAGKRWAFYNGYRPITGTQVMDADAIEFRVIPWIAWKYDVDQYFYWMTNYWNDWRNSKKNNNVFVDPQTSEFSRMGCGTFFYPGHDVIFPDQDRDLPGPISSIRMKNWRRGMQDYEYLWLAEQLGLKDDVVKIVDQAVPAALWEANLGSNISWPDHGYGFERYRRELANLISSHTEQPLEQPLSEMCGSSSTQDDPSRLPASIDITPSFIDVAIDNPFFPHIEALYQSGYTSGCQTEPAKFCPNQPITRVEMAILLERELHGPDFIPTRPTAYHFRDVGVTTWGSYWIEQFYRDGFTRGYRSYLPVFGGNDALARADGAVYVLKALHGPGYSPSARETSFIDVASNSWYASWITEAYTAGLILPCEADESMKFCPNDPFTREDAAYGLAEVMGIPASNAR